MNPGFQLYRADGRQRVWRRVGERFADVNVVQLNALATALVVTPAVSMAIAINSLINSIRRSVTLHEANDGHTRY